MDAPRIATRGDEGLRDGIISCHGLTKRFGQTLAVDRLDLSVRAGEVFGFLGPNGAGKTTTLRMLLGLIRPNGGSALIDGRSLSDPRSVASVGAMVEEPPFYPWLSGWANLRVLAGVGPPLDRGSIEAAMDRTGIIAAAGDKVKTYSQGMRQRLGLAAALMRGPRLLLLDEPTNGLDPAGIVDVRAILRDLADEGTTVLLSSHLLSEVERICDRVAILDHGRLVALGTLDELGGSRPVVRVEVEAKAMATAMHLLREHRPVRMTEGVLQVEARSGREIAEALARAGIYPEGLSTERPGLEQLFMRLTTMEGSRAPSGE